MVAQIPAGVTENGTIEVVAPVDYLSWTSRVAQFASIEKIPEKSYRIIISGQMSPRSRSGFTAAGWQISNL
jgi:hypothetical protein